MKRTLTLVLILICICTNIFCSHAQAAEIVDSGTCGENVQWSLDADGVLIIGGEGDMTNFGYTSIGHLTTPWHNYGEDGVKSIVIGEGVTSIGDYAFDIMYSFEKTLSIPSTVKQISTNAFLDSNFTHINVDDENPYYADLDGVLFNKDLTTLIYYPRNKSTLNNSYQVPESVRIIEEYAFYYNENIMEIVFPSNLQTIGDHAFTCSALQSVEFPSTLESIGDFAFYMLNTETVNIPGKVSQIGKHAFYGSTLSEMKLECDAPSNSLNLPGDIVLYYYSDKSGWTTPTWNGYACYPMGTSAPTPTPDISCNHIDDLGYALYGEILKTWKEYPYFGTAEQCYVVEYDSYICSGCGETATWHSDWYDDHVFGANGVCGNCGYTADGVYVGTEATSTPKPTNTPTTVPTATPTTDPTSTPTTVPSAAPVKTAKTLDDLTDIDYLAFADIAYMNFAEEVNYVANQNKSIRELLSNIWDSLWAYKEEAGIEILYSELYEHIGDWRFIRRFKNPNTGFFAMAFENDNNEIVIAYRGSHPLNPDKPLNTILTSNDAWKDWIENDLPAIFGNSATGNSQIPDAIKFYKRMIEGRSTEQVALAGHSLGGALANIVSAYSGSRAVSVNSISALDVAYEEWIEEFSTSFIGVDMWNFYDITNEGDNWAGYFDVLIKPASIRQSTTPWGTLFGSHDISSLVTKDTHGNVSLTKEINENHPRVEKWSVGNSCYLNLGTRENDNFHHTNVFNESWIDYGGNGVDIFTGDNDSKNETYIGGQDNDIVDGSWGDDKYYYNKGDGVDIISDKAGKDTIYLLGFSENDVIAITSLPAKEITYVATGSSEYFIGFAPNRVGDVISKEEIPTETSISCNGETIIQILGYRDTNKLNEFRLVTTRGEKTEEQIIWFNPYTQQLTQHLVVSCPVDIEIVDGSGSVVYTLYDSKPGSYYTAYGNFYVTPLENSTHCNKVLDLFEGYSVRIKGIGNGTMDISVYDTDGHTLFDPVGAEDVIITPKTVATLEEHPDTGKLALVVDHDGNGIPDGEIVLRPVHPNVDDHDQPLMKVDAVEPTCEKTGNVEYYICSCGKMFSDAEGKNEITDRNSVIIPLSEEHQYEKGVCKICGQKEIAPDDLPQTGDYSRLELWFALLAVSLVAGFCFTRKNIKA